MDHNPAHRSPQHGAIAAMGPRRATRGRSCNRFSKLYIIPCLLMVNLLTKTLSEHQPASTSSTMTKARMVHDILDHKSTRRRSSSLRDHYFAKPYSSAENDFVHPRQSMSVYAFASAPYVRKNAGEELHASMSQDALQPAQRSKIFSNGFLGLFGGNNDSNAKLAPAPASDKSAEAQDEDQLTRQPVQEEKISEDGHEQVGFPDPASEVAPTRPLRASPPEDPACTPEAIVQNLDQLKDGEPDLDFEQKGELDVVENQDYSAIQNFPPAEDLVATVRDLCQNGKSEEALELVRTDLRNVSQPQCSDIMLAFADIGRSDCAQAVLLHMQMLGVETGASLDTETYNGLMLAYARDAATADSDGLEQTFAVLELMTRAQVAPDITTYNRLMEACSAAAESVDPYQKGLQVLDMMRESKVKPDVNTFNTMLEACGKRGWSKNTGDGLRLGALIIEKMTEYEVPPTVDTFNILMYGIAWAAGAGDGWVGVEKGLEFLVLMAEKKIMPDVITFNNLIAACAQAAGSAGGALAREQAFKMLWIMHELGLDPDKGTCDTLIATCAKTAAAGDMEGIYFGVAVLELVHDWKLSPDPNMYNALLNVCLRSAEAGDLSRPFGWNHVRWIAHLLSLMNSFGPDMNPQIRMIFDNMTSLCVRKAAALEKRSKRQGINEAKDEDGERFSAGGIRLEAVGDDDHVFWYSRDLWPRKSAQSSESGLVHDKAAGETNFEKLKLLATDQIKNLRSRYLEQAMSPAPADRHTAVTDEGGEAHVKDLEICLETNEGEEQQMFDDIPMLPGEDDGDVEEQRDDGDGITDKQNVDIVYEEQEEEAQERNVEHPEEICTAAEVETPNGHMRQEYQESAEIESEGMRQEQNVRDERAERDLTEEIESQKVEVRLRHPSPDCDEANHKGQEEEEKCTEYHEGGEGALDRRFAPHKVHGQEAEAKPNSHARPAGTHELGEGSDGVSLCTPWAEEIDDSWEERGQHDVEQQAETRHSRHQGHTSYTFDLRSSRADRSSNTRKSHGKCSSASVAISPRPPAVDPLHFPPRSPRGLQEYIAQMIDFQRHGRGKNSKSFADNRRTREEIRRMDVGQVCNWLKSVGLADCAEYFQEACVDGAGLVQLRELLAREVQTFYDAVEKRLGVNKFGLVLRLADSLQCL
mmetsp:Transcript_4912/g.17807  ORF Transcript_4912/g.17807 Transcript_4912/m.17807 type:complete len:1153 (-) Transcript_4912:125-3583(-)